MTFYSDFSHKTAELMSNESVSLASRLHAVADYCNDLSSAILTATAESKNVADRDGPVNVDRIISSINNTNPTFSPAGNPSNPRAKPPYHSDILDR